MGCLGLIMEESQKCLTAISRGAKTWIVQSEGLVLVRPNTSMVGGMGGCWLKTQIMGIQSCEAQHQHGWGNGGCWLKTQIMGIQSC